MVNAQLAELFGRVADLLEIRGENRFRVNSYRRVARTLEDYGEDVASLAARNSLTDIPGVGDATADKIREYLATGKMALLDEARGDLPETILELLAISGLGPKTVALLHEKLGVGSIAELEIVLAAGKVEGLPGMGAKKVDNLRKGIAEFKSLRAAGAGKRTLLGSALPAAEDVMARLRAVEGVRRVEAAGSLRRRRETVGDTDILVEAADGGRVLAEFVKLPVVESVLGQGETKASVRTARGMQIDVRVVPAESWGAALQYFTGSKEHNVRLRELAVKRGWRLNEWGLFDGAGARIAGADEEGVYRALGLAWVPPELREDRGEVQAAIDGRLPADLLTDADIRCDLHMHTTASDGRHTIVEMARAALERGLACIAVTDHSQSLGVARGLSPDRLREHIRNVRRAQDEVPGIRLLVGTESDILEDGSLDYDDALLGELDVVIGSLHGGLKMERAAMTKRVLRAMEHPRMHIFGHPTARLIHGRAPVELDMEAVIAAAVKRNVALEINANPARLDLNDGHVRAALAAGARLSINTDAHSTGELSQMTYGVATARRGWARKGDVINTLAPAELVKRLDAKR